MPGEAPAPYEPDYKEHEEVYETMTDEQEKLTREREAEQFNRENDPSIAFEMARQEDYGYTQVEYLTRLGEILDKSDDEINKYEATHALVDEYREKVDEGHRFGRSIRFKDFALGNSFTEDRDRRVSKVETPKDLEEAKDWTKRQAEDAAEYYQRRGRQEKFLQQVGDQLYEEIGLEKGQPLSAAENTEFQKELKDRVEKAREEYSYSDLLAEVHSIWATYNVLWGRITNILEDERAKSHVKGRESRDQDVERFDLPSLDDRDTGDALGGKIEYMYPESVGNVMGRLILRKMDITKGKYAGNLVVKEESPLQGKIDSWVEQYKDLAGLGFNFDSKYGLLDATLSKLLEEELIQRSLTPEAYKDKDKRAKLISQIGNEYNAPKMLAGVAENELKRRFNKEETI
ncbi:MAG: hypothetical protein WCP14_01715 [bacterium]